MPPEKTESGSESGAQRRSSAGGLVGDLSGRGSRVIAASLTFAVAMAAMTLLGRFVDGRLGTSPVFLIVGALWAFVGGFYYLLKQLAPELLDAGAGSAGHASGGGDVASRRRDQGPGAADRGGDPPGPDSP